MRHFSFIPLVFLVLLTHAQITSTFDVGVDGWTCTDNGGSTSLTVNYNSTGGNPGGYISAGTTSSQPFFFVSPSQFGGNIAYFSYGQELTFDIQLNHVGTVHGASTLGDVQIRIPSGQVLSLNLPTFPAQAPAWSSFSVRLDETAGWRVGNTGGPLATRAQMLQYLSGVHSFRFSIKYTSSTTVGGAIDNVTLNRRSILLSPSISSFSPTSGSPGSSITINGGDFDPIALNNAVFFGGQAGTITNANATSLTVTVPPGATYGNITVINKTTGLSKSSQEPFVPTFEGGGRIIPASLDPKFDITIAGGFGGFSLADMDGDGWTDIVVAEDDNTDILVYRNLGNSGDLTAASFAAPLNFPTLLSGTNGSGLTTTDFDNDGKLDMATSGWTGGPGAFATFRNMSTPGNLSFEAVEHWNGATDESPVNAAHDIDGDGLVDLVSGEGSSPGSTWICQNLSTPGDILFGYRQTLSLAGSNSHQGATLADLNNDGKPEFIHKIQNALNQQNIYVNTSTPGSISFGATLTLPVSIQGRMVVYDFNKDGINDLAWKNGFSNDDVHIRINTNSGGTLAVSDFATEIILDGDITNYGAMSLADINGDGKPDILATDNGDLGIFENVFSGGVFDATAFIPGYQFQGNGGSTYPTIAHAADLNGDNKPDIVVGVTNTSPDRLSIYENKNVHAPVISVNTVSPLKGAVGSTVTITGNNFSPVLAENEVYFGAVKANVLTATATQLEATVPAGTTYAAVSVRKGELTSSYHLPFVTTFSPGVNFDNTHFAPPVEFSLSGANYDIEVKDLDLDGKPDLAAEGASLRTYFFLNTHGSGAISSTSLTSSGLTNTSAGNPRVLDCDGDGLADIVSPNGRMYQNLSSPGTITFSTDISLGLGDSNIDFGDLNLDGKPDLAIAGGGSAQLRLMENRSKAGTLVAAGTFGTFSNDFVITKPAAGGGIVVADFDADSFPDVIVTNPSSDNLSIFPSANATRVNSSTFGPRIDIGTGDNPGRIYTGDFDNDNKLDFFIYHGTGTNSTLLSVFHNQSTPGNFLFNRIDITNPSATTVATIADLDGDGKPEIITTSETGNRFSIFKNVHTSGALTIASFAAPFNTTVTAPRGITTGDLNLDGKPEIILTRAAGLLGVYENLVPTSCVPPSERAALIALYNATDGSNWTDNTNWLGGDESTWAGVSITGCNVTGLFFQNNNLNGSLPVELGDLTELTTLSITLNPNLSGGIPVTLGNLSQLTTLQLWNNNLTGPIPTTLGNLNNLLRLELRNNQLSGNLPSTLGNIATLEHLELDGNLLTGTIPTSFFGLTNLKTLELGANQLTGSISPSIAGLANLESLGLSGNQLSGTLPTELGSLIKLTRLQLAVNQFTGNLPASIGNLISLTSFSVFNNQLTGSVPSSLSNLVNLTGLGLSVNQFTGDVPAGIGLIPNLSDVSVRDNDFTSIPTFVSTSFTDLLVYGNKLHFGHLEPNISKTGFVYSPQDNLPGGTLSVCEGSTLTINFSTPGTANQYQWYKDGSPITGANSSNFSKTIATVSDAGNYTVQVTNTIVTGLTLTSDIFNVSIEQAPCSNQPPVITSTASGAQIEGIVIIDLLSLISDPDGNLDPSTLSVVGSTSEQGASTSINSSSELVLDYSGVLFTGIDHVTIEVCDLSGVCVQQELTIDVAGDVIIYNAISPNSDDNLNKIFTIQYIEVFPGTEKNRVTIYNRWGDVVWEGIDYDNSSVVFDGTSTDGKELPSGTYFYKIEYTGGRTAKTGYLSLKK